MLVLADRRPCSAHDALPRLSFSEINGRVAGLRPTVLPTSVPRALSRGAPHSIAEAVEVNYYRGRPLRENVVEFSGAHAVLKGDDSHQESRWLVTSPACFHSSRYQKNKAGPLSSGDFCSLIEAMNMRSPWTVDFRSAVGRHQLRHRKGCSESSWRTDLEIC